MKTASVYISGTGAVSPAGWGVSSLIRAVEEKVQIEPTAKLRPGWTEGILINTVPLPSPRPAFLAQPRMRRSSPISQYTVGAALEAIGSRGEEIRSGKLRLGIILCVMSGCVNYSRRFYEEALRDPATASPLVFPETVFNAPSSHLTALLDSKAINYTIVGDPGTFLQGLAMGSEWLLEERVDLCLVVGTEEQDWLTASAFTYFSKE
ncbi:MAG: beta-ketoacyl synthase, partial [Verrucomicrobiales bacterium]|nr:beta-ketoacyl synthase [Verrucomicrobiales bacterium]